MPRLAEPHRRETILKAASEVFLEKGFSKARLQDIAERAGVGTSTLYLYFQSKEEMLHAIAQDMREQLGIQVVPVLAKLTSEADIEYFVQTVIDFSLAHTDLLKLWNLESGLRRVRSYNFRVARGPLFERGVKLFTRLMVEGKIRRYDPPFLIDLLVGFLRWMLETAPLLDEEERSHFRETCVRWLCNALLPES